MWILSLGWEDPLEKEMATHSSILAQEIPWILAGYCPWGHKESDTIELGDDDELLGLGGDVQDSLCHTWRLRQTSLEGPCLPHSLRCYDRRQAMIADTPMAY